MSMKSRLAALGGAPSIFSDDVFSTYLYTGNGSTQTINNGIDLAGNGGMVWVKSRSAATDPTLTDTVRGATKALISDTTAAQTTDTNGLTAFSSTGFSIGTDSVYNTNAATYASWTFRKAPKFFDVVTWTGNGTSNRQIAHSLGIAPGMIVIKRTDTTGFWRTYHVGAGKSYGAPNVGNLNISDMFYGYSPNEYYPSDPTSSVFTIGNQPDVNASGGTYVAYLFAHDTDPTGIIQCGSFTTDGSGNATVNLGWEPQYVMIKLSSTGTANWAVFDTMRGMPIGNSNIARLFPNTSAAETLATDYDVSPNATGFKALTTGYPSGTFIYIAIRRPNKPPTSGTQVFSPQIATQNLSNNNLPSSGFPIDASIILDRGGTFGFDMMIDRLRGKGGGRLTTNNADSEGWTTYFNFDAQTNLYITGALESTSHPFVFWNFKRAPGFFDVVCWTGDGSYTGRNHNLTVVPELVIQKRRNGVGNWFAYTTSMLGYLELTDAFSGLPRTLTSTTFQPAGDTSGDTNVTYLFATLAGVSKVFSFTGNGSSQTINCGFSTGARFILIKCTSSTGDWFVWDTARGIISANDPHLSLNTTAAEVTTDDSIDPDSTGFIVNQNSATNINVNGQTYIGLAIS